MKKTYRELLSEISQQHTSADTSLNQVSSGIRHAASAGLIKPHSTNVDVGGGKYDAGKHHIEKSVEGSSLHVYDPYNRAESHNTEVLHNHEGKADYVGLHNVLNVIKEPENRAEALHTVKKFMKPGGTAHITTYEGDKSGTGRMSKQDKGRGSSWQNHRSTKSYVPEVQTAFPNHRVHVQGKHIIISPS